jgi:flagellar biosynthesis GTPase FlhF
MLDFFRLLFFFLFPVPVQVVATRDKGALRCTYRATVRVTLKDGAFRDGVGFGTSQGTDEHAVRCEAIDAALRDAQGRAHQAFAAPAAAAVPPSAVAVTAPPPQPLARRDTTGVSSPVTASAPPLPVPQPQARATSPETASAPAAAVEEEEDDGEAERVKLAEAEARRLELRRQKQEEEEIERRRIEQEEEDERLRAEREEEEERQREREEEQKRAEEERRKAEEERRKAEEEAAKKAKLAPPAAAPRLAGAALAAPSPDLGRRGPPAPVARPKALATKTAVPGATSGAAAAAAVASPPPQVMPIVPRAASVPNAGRGPVRAAPAAVAPPQQAVLSRSGGAPTSPASGADSQRKQLSLSSRKNVKQNQPQFAEHAGRLQERLGLDTQVQSKVDWLILADVCDEGGHKNLCGEIFYNQVMGGLVHNLVQLSDKGRDALMAKWSSGAISLAFDAGQASQWSARFVDGDMELVCRGQPWEETDTVGAKLLEELGGAPKAASGAAAGGALQANVAQFAPVFAEHAAAIKKAVGMDAAPTHNVNFEELNGHLKALGKENVAGQVFQEHVMRELAGNIGRLCQKSMVAKAIRRLWLSGVISLAFNEQQKDAWNTQLLKGGCLITARPSALLAGHEAIGKNVVDLVTDDDTGLPILSAQDMADNDATIRGNLERIRTAVGLQYDIVPDIDFFELSSHVNSVPGFENKVRSKLSCSFYCSFFVLEGWERVGGHLGAPGGPAGGSGGAAGCSGHSGQHLGQRGAEACV